MGSVTRWIGDLQQGDTAALSLLFARYHAEGLRLAERHLHAVVRGPVDSDDVAQQVFIALWKEWERGTPLVQGLSDRHSFVIALAKLTHQQVRDIHRHHRRLRRDARRTIQTGYLTKEGEVPTFEVHPFDHRPSESECVEGHDWVNQLLSRAPNRQRAIVEHKLIGMSNDEVAYHVGCSLRTVEREINEFRSRIARMAESSSRRPQ